MIIMVVVFTTTCVFKISVYHNWSC